MPHENINDAKVWLSYAQDDLGVAKHSTKINYHLRCNLYCRQYDNFIS
jgi:hypothetical protein